MSTAATIGGCYVNGAKTAACHDSVITSLVGLIVPEPTVSALMDFLIVERDLGGLK